MPNTVMAAPMTASVPAVLRIWPDMEPRVFAATPMMVNDAASVINDFAIAPTLMSPSVFSGPAIMDSANAMSNIDPDPLMVP